jgi:hypothetical protein
MTSKSRRRFGSVRKLPSGRFQVRYWDATGRQQRASNTFATRTDANRYLACVEADLQREDWVDPRLALATVAEWAEVWLQTEAHLKPKTRAGYENVLRKHVVPAFGPLPVSTIEQVDVRRFVAELLKGGAAPGTVSGARKVLRLVLATAVGSGAIKANPCDGVRVPRSARDEMGFLDPEQIVRLASCIQEPYGVLIKFAAYTGLRAARLAPCGSSGRSRSRGSCATSWPRISPSVGPT